MNTRNTAWLPLAVAVVALGCVLPLKPKDFKIPDGAVPRVEGGPVAVRAGYAGSGKRVLQVPGSSVSVSDDEYSLAVVERLVEQLRKREVRVEPGASRSIEIQVVRVSIHQKPQFTCVIDFNRRLGGAPPRGSQSRAEHWNYQTACAAAVSQVVIDTLNDPSTRDYLKGA